MLENQASGTERGGEQQADERLIKLEDTIRVAVEQFGSRAVGEVYAKLQSERQVAAVEEARQAVIDLTASGGLLTLAAEREIIERTGIERRLYQGVLNQLIWRQQENEDGILEFNGYGFATRITVEQIAEKFRQERAQKEALNPKPVTVEKAIEPAPISDADKDYAEQFILSDIQLAGVTRYEHIYARSLKAGVNQFAIVAAIIALANTGRIKIERLSLGIPGGDITAL